MFKKVLIANRGEIAVRIIRTCRRLGLRTVAVYSDADAKAQHVALADERAHIGDSRAADSYLNIPALLKAVQEHDCDVVHPGYGLLSEDPEFASRLRAAGVTFVGPSEDALRTFGNKLSARRFAAAQGIDCPPGTTEPVDPEDEQELARLASEIGYPVLVKAASGGGGIGMQPVLQPEGLLTAVQTCAARGQAAFSDARVYLERYFKAPRHIEAQVLVDSFGQVAVLGERECSVQRRHQKVLEESPSPGSFWTKELRSRLHAGAGRLLAAAGYVGAGTVEYLLDVSGPRPEFFFLEVNARLQVEHPVTELCFGVDLVEQQLRIAAGERLKADVVGAKSRGHAVELRLYAEDPARKFLPQPGSIERLEWPSSADLEAGCRGASPLLRVDAGYRAGDEVTRFYDPLIAKLVCWAEDRAQALDYLAAEIAQIQLVVVGKKGPRNTNLPLLRELLDDARVRSGDYDTTILGA